MVLYIGSKEYQTQFQDIVPTKIYFYLYEICESQYFHNSINDTIGGGIEERSKIIDDNYEEINKFNNKIFLKVFLSKDEINNVYSFPSAIIEDEILEKIKNIQNDNIEDPFYIENNTFIEDNTPIEDNAFREDNKTIEDIIIDYALEKLSELVYSHEYINQYKQYYKGFIQSPENADECILIFDCGIKPTFTNTKIECCVIDEIINKKKILDTQIDPFVRKCFFNNKRWLYLTNELYQNLEIPQVFYYHTDEDIDITRTEGEYGYFYYFDAEKIEMKQARRYVCFIEDSVLWANNDNSKNDENLLFQSISIAFNNTNTYCNKIIGDYLFSVVQTDDIIEQE